MINYNGEDESNFFCPKSEEDRVVCQAKLAAFTEIRCWIENVTNQRFSHIDDFRRSLSDGCILCNLLNCLKPGSVKRINKISGYDNIGKFLRICEEDFGLRHVILFEVSDLEDLSGRPTDMTMESDRRLQRVLICLFHLAKSVEHQLTNVTLDSTPFKILLQSQDLKEMRRLKANTTTTDSSHGTNVSKIIQNKNPDYLATRANETLNKSKANQEILHRFSNDEEWQESLENWREKRRQVVSSTALDDSKEERTCDNQELLELKERARKMKLLRDQLKDQSAVNVPQNVEQIENGDGKVIPNIDEETMAMIERVKQKKLDEENKRKFNISPQLSNAFASDSEQSTSTAVDKLEDDTQSISEIIVAKSDPKQQLHTPEIPAYNLSTTDMICNSQKEDDVEPEIADAKTRFVTVKLIKRSTQANDQLMGMDITDGERGVVIFKVKIGSCADLCDVRKGDEIVRINSENVSNKTVEYVRSLFNNCESLTSGVDAVTLCLRRNISDEEAEFYSSDQSEADDENKINVTHDCTPVADCKQLHEHEIIDDFIEIDTIDPPEYVHDLSDTAKEIVLPNEELNKHLFSNKTQTSPLLADNYVTHNDESSYNISVNPLSQKSEITNAKDETAVHNDISYQLSVQDKITKIESQNVINTVRLSASWNTPRTSATDPVFTKCTTHMGQSIDRLCWNNDNFKYRQLGSGNSSLSNLYHYWETEAPKSVSTSQTNKITKSAPVIQSPIRSTIGDRDKSVDIDMEMAEQQFESSNCNLEQTWRNVHSSGNSSTSDDISALNDTIIMPQSKSPNVRGQVVDPVNNLAGDRAGVGIYDNNASLPISKTDTDQCLVTRPVLDTTDAPIDIIPLRTNASTGIQADLLQCRKPANYTNITTAFKSRSNKSNSYQSSQKSDDETCSITLSNLQDYRQNNGPSSPESKDSYYMNIQSMDIINVNDLSKDYTTVTAVTQRNDIPRKVGAVTPLSNESSITGVSDNNEKSVEIEVSITPQLFPIRHRTLLQRSVDDKYINSKSNDISTISNNSFAEDITLQSDYVKVTDLDDVISPTREDPICQGHSISNGIVIDKYDNKIPSKNSDPKSSDVQPHVKMRKKHLKNNSAELPIENGKRSSDSIVYSDNTCHSLFTDQPTSTVPVPTLFKSGPKSENTLSQGQMSSRSDSGKSKKLESILSSKKMKNRNPSGSNSLTESKRSSSTKELRFQDLPDDKDWNFTNSDISKRTLSFSDQGKTSSVNNTKYSTPQSTHNQSSDILPVSTNTKSHTKSYTIERSMKNLSSNLNPSKKTSKKTEVSNGNETKTAMKCNYCAAFVGLEEDLMVIEELNLHFHLKCFICSECKRPLGDGKSDTDVRIRRSKLHCMTCYHKKSSKSKHRISSTLDRTSQSVGNITQNKGGHGDGLELHVHASNSNNCAIASNNNTNNNNNNTAVFQSSLISGTVTHSFTAPLQLQISYLDTF